MAEHRDNEAIKALLPKLSFAAATKASLALTPQQVEIVLEYFATLKPVEGVAAEVDLRAGDVTLAVGKFEVRFSEDGGQNVRIDIFNEDGSSNFSHTAQVP